MGYITNLGARNISTYKMSATVDNSLVYNFILSPLCNFLVNFIPPWVAPNLLTALGFVCLVLSSLLSVAFVGIQSDKHDNEVAPFALVSAILIFCYMLLDNTDGKQARRTQSSSPLGELIDHGSDSMTVGIGALNLGVLLGFDPWSIFLVSIIGSLPFYLAHWEEYFTHSLVLGMLNGPTETETLAIILFLMTYANGLSWWTEHTSFFSGAPFLVTLQRYKIIVYLAIFMSLFTALQSLYTGLRKASAQGVTLATSFSQLLPITLVWISTALWVYFTPLFSAHSVWFISTFGFVFSTLVGRCIVQRICNEPFRLFYPVIIPLLVACANTLSRFPLGAPLVDEYTVLVLASVSSFVGWSHFVVSIIREMCTVLNISAFTISYKLKR